jgi:dTDP-4-amino-4,6-dideoxygalactose transaminase
VGAQPVFCDIRDDSLCIDLDKAEQLIGPRTKAIIVMDYDCCLCDHDRVADLAQEYGLRVIHDAAHSLGSFYKGRLIGSFSDICMFSFDPVKTITCIDGGALVVRTQEDVEALHEIRLLGMGQPSSVMYQNKRAWTYHVKRLGFRYHMANLHAAIGLAQLSKLPEIAASRREACQTYNRILSSVQQIRTPLSTFEQICPFLYYIRVPEADRDALRAWLGERGIDTGIHWQPGHSFELLAHAPSGDLSVTDVVSSEVLSLPLHSNMDLGLVERICGAVADYFWHSEPA